MPVTTTIAESDQPRLQRPARQVRHHEQLQQRGDHEHPPRSSARVIRQRGPGCGDRVKKLSSPETRGVARVVDHLLDMRQRRPALRRPLPGGQRLVVAEAVDQVVLGAVRAGAQQRGAEVAREARGHLRGRPPPTARRRPADRGARPGPRSRCTGSAGGVGRPRTGTAVAGERSRKAQRGGPDRHPGVRPDSHQVSGRGTRDRARGRHRLAGRAADEHRAGRRRAAPGRPPGARSWPPPTSPARPSPRWCPAASTC